jgi:hypothetical protein
MAQPSIVTDIYQGRARCTFSPGRHTYSVRVHGHVDKLWQPSVTGILGVKGKPALTNWAAKKSLEYVAKKLGTYESGLGAPPFTVDTKEIHSWLAEAADSWNESQETTIGSLAHRVFEAEVKHRAGLGPKPNTPVVYDPVTMPEYTEGMIESANLAIQAGFTFLDEHHVEPIMLERVLWSPTTGTIGTTDFIGKIDGELAVGDWKTSKRIFPEYRIQLAKYAQMYYEEFRTLPLVRWAINTRKDGGLDFEKYGIDSYQSDLDAFDACQVLYNFNREHDDYAKGTPVQVLGDLDNLIARTM